MAVEEQIHTTYSYLPKKMKAKIERDILNLQPDATTRFLSTRISVADLHRGYDQGVTDDLCRISSLYYRGELFEHNPTFAILLMEYISNSDRETFLECEFALANMYLGFKESEKAFNLFTKLANKYNYGMAFTKLSHFYRYGVVVKKSTIEQEKNLKLGAKTSDPQSVIIYAKYLMKSRSLLKILWGFLRFSLGAFPLILLSLKPSYTGRELG